MLELAKTRGVTRTRTGLMDVGIGIAVGRVNYIKDMKKKDICSTGVGVHTNKRGFSSSPLCFVNDNNNNNNNNNNSLPPIREVLSFVFNNELNKNSENSNENNSENSNVNNSENSNENNSENSNDNNSPTDGLDDNSTSSFEDAYETDSNRSFFEDGTEAMLDTDPKVIPEDFLRQYIKETRGIVKDEFPEPQEDNDLHEKYSDRNQELRAELRDRKDRGMVPQSPSDISPSTSPSPSPSPSRSPEANLPISSENNTYNDSINKNNTVSSIPTDSSSTHKRKFDEDDGSSIQSSKRFKEESSDNTVTNSTSDTASTNHVNQSPLDYVLEKQSTEMSDIYEADGE